MRYNHFCGFHKLNSWKAAAFGREAVVFRLTYSPGFLIWLGLGYGVFLDSPAAWADLIRLKSGGEIRGGISQEKGATTGPEVTISTLAGTDVTVAQEQIEFITRRPLKIEEYESRAKRTPVTVEAQWKLAEWCRTHNLRSQREVHLENIVKLDPDHEKAHYGLKHTKVDGVWMSREERMISQGYVKHKGRWMTPQERELTEKTEAEREREEKWFPQVHLWKNWLTGSHAGRSRDALSAFRELKDPNAVAALVKNFQNEDDQRLRSLYVQVLANMPGTKPVPALVAQSLLDVNYEIRYAALNAIKPDQYEAATTLYVRELRNSVNAIVGRAGKALGRMADERVVPQLIDALITTHQYQIRVPVQNSPGFIANGSGMTNGGVSLPPEVAIGLRTGQYNGVIINQPQAPVKTKVVTIEREEQNSEVLETLQKITGKNFGYNERTWKLWHAAQKNGAGNVPALP